MSILSNTVRSQIDYSKDRNIIGFTLDKNGDGYINPLDHEMIAYQINKQTLKRYNSSTSKWEIISQNIDALDFVYLDQEGNRTFDVKEFKAIELTIIAKTNKKDSKFKDSTSYKNKQGESMCPSCLNSNHHRRAISITLQLRNLNL